MLCSRVLWGIGFMGAVNLRHVRNRRNKRIIFFILALVFFIFSLFAVLVDWRVRPMIETYGNNQAITSATLAINHAVEGVLSNLSVDYGDLATVTKDNEGKILSVETDTSNMNILKSAVSKAVLEQLEEQKVQKIDIPLGSLIGGLLTGRGPNITIKVPMNSTVETSYKNLFESAGINQTRHEITLEVTAIIYTVIQGESKATQVNTGFTIADSIIVGEVPNWMVGRY